MSTASECQSTPVPDFIRLDFWDAEILPFKLAVKITKAVRSQTAMNSFLSNVQFSRRETGPNTMNIFAFSISVSHSHSLSSRLHTFCSVSLGSDAQNVYLFFKVKGSSYTKNSYIE